MRMVPALLVLLLAYCAPAHAQASDIKILFVGDVMLDGLPGKYIGQGKDPFSQFSEVFERADIKIGNLECVVGTTGTAEDKPYTFRARPAVVPLLKKYFSAVSVANNHTGDFGPKAFSSMLDLFDAAGLKYFGGGKDLRAALEPALFDVRGKRIAVLGYDFFFPRSFEALDDRPGTAWGENDYVVASIKRAKEFYKADIVITYPHWGWEYEKIASPRERKLAHLMLDSGADAVIGGHPHVTQNIEVYKGKPIFYSLGNFIFDGFDDPETTTGWLLELSIRTDSTLGWTLHRARLDDEGIPMSMGVSLRH